MLEIGRRIVDRIGVRADHEVLDVATGTGSAAIPAAVRGARVVGLDLVPALLDAARERARYAGADIEWIKGDAEDLPFADACFDVVLSTLGVQFTPRHEVATVDFERESAFVDFMAAAYGPLVKAREALTPQGRWEDLRRDLVRLGEERNAAGDGSFRVASEYRVVIGAR